MGRKIEDLTGRRFDSLVADKYERRNGRAYWWCQCDCGEYKLIRASSLKNGATKSCGCCAGGRTGISTGISVTPKSSEKRGRLVRDLTGHRFGRLTALYCAPKEPMQPHTKWVCVCDCGKTTTVFAQNLHKGTTTSCGCYWREQRRKSYQTQKKRSDNKSGEKSIYYVKLKSGERWQVSFFHGGKYFYVGRFHTIEEACIARDEAMKKAYAHLYED